jgi:hypothetical protein
MHRDTLSYLALALLLGMGTFLIYLLFYIHEIPYKIACRRNHPQRDAIYAACWVSLCVLHVIWPLLFIWAVMKPGANEAIPAAPGKEAGS